MKYSAWWYTIRVWTMGHYNKLLNNDKNYPVTLEPEPNMVKQPWLFQY